jgi:hypothetical protein
LEMANGLADWRPKFVRHICVGISKVKYSK